MKKLLFESKTCGRCAGTGAYSWNPRDGSRCFGCNGRGGVLTKRGAAAQAFYTASITVAVTDLRVGDKVIADGMTLGGGMYHYIADVVSVGELAWNGVDSSTTNGVTTPTYRIDVELKNVKNGELHGVGALANTTFRKVWSPEETAAKQAAALAYQDTLTATGTVRKALRGVSA